MSLLSKYINRQLAAYQSELVQTHYQEVENMYRQIRGGMIIETISRYSKAMRKTVTWHRSANTLMS